MKKFYHLLLMLLFVSMGHSWAQTGAMNPNDPVREYRADSVPVTPPWNNLVVWVKTSRLNWNTSSYKAYYYNGMPFRLKFPKTYVPGGTKKYPLLVFFHGVGEKGTIYDNEFQLYHGGQLMASKVDDGSFDGFLLYPQNQSGFFGNPQYDNINALINNYLIPQNNVDPYRILVNGLSGGGASSWEYMIRYPKQVAASTPISAASTLFKNDIPVYKYTPIWQFQGGQDTNPDPGTTQNVQDAILAAGGNIKVTVYPGVGHGCWYNAWGEPDFYPFLLRAHKANPWPLTGRTEFCPDDAINVTLGLTAGFDGYEWRKDGVVIPGATSNTITVTAIGTYDARIKTGADWSPYSPAPVVIKIKTPTVSPTITVPGLQSKVIPTPEGKTSVLLQVPPTFATYSWRKTSDTVTQIGNANTYQASAPGGYVVKVMEQYGCASSFSSPFTVISATGANAPGAAAGVTALPLSKTQLEVDWTRNPNAPYPETGYEIYRSVTSGSGYVLAAITPAGAVTYVDNGLNANTKYYYIVRAVNNNGAAAVSNEASAKTLVDNVPPTSPPNLRITGTSSNYVSLAWDAATDDVGVDKYDVYINGVKSYVVPGTQTTFTAYNLTKGNVYTFVIKARDLAGNVSPASNQANTQAILKGLNYKVVNGTFSVLPNFDALTPVASGITPAVDLSVRTADVNYGIIWQGFINITVAGNYTFGITSDDGSRLYINVPYSSTATPTIDNDGLHGDVSKEATLNLAVGIYPFTATFFQQGGGQTMNVYWKNTANGVTTAQSIPASAFTEGTSSPGNPPAAPSNINTIATSYNKINLTWNDNSSNETGFEIYRSTTATGVYNTIYTTGANATSFTDSTVVPQTTYYYKIQAINQYGSSGFSQDNLGGLSYAFYYTPGASGTLPNFNNLTPTSTGLVSTVSLSVATRTDNFAILYKGIINIPTAGQYTFYTASDDGSNLLIDSVQIVNNNFAQGTTERSGKVTLTAGIHKFQVGYAQGGGGYTLTASYAGPGISKRLIPDSVLFNKKMRATTLALPGSPVSPSNLVATAVSSNKISLNWNDNSNNETTFEIYRSNPDNSNFKLIGTVAADVHTYTDSTLFANLIYYYKVRALNAGGNSGYSNEANATTLNHLPVFTNNLTDRTTHYSMPLIISLAATDADAEVLTFTGENVPAFGTLADNGNGTATLSFNPANGDIGVYPNIKVKVTDQHGGVTTQAFTLTVTNTYTPVLNNISNVTLNGGASTQVNITATNNNQGDVLTWTASGLPAFATLTPNSNSATISVNPTNADAGFYPVTVTISGSGGTDSKTFNIVVNVLNPNKRVYIDFTDGTLLSGGYWNNTTKQPALNDTYTNLKDSSLTPTTIGFQIMTPWQNLTNGSNVLGATTGNNSGVYPDNVMITAYWSSTVKQTIKFTGLKTGAAYKYKFTFFGSRGSVTDNRTSVYTVNGASVTLNAAGNTTNTVSLSNIIPNASGEVTLDLTSGAGSQYSYLNAMIIDESYDDQTAPAKPGNLTATQATKGVKLTWTDFAYNEVSYDVYRADSLKGAYTLLKSTAANTVTYTDSTAKANATYAYAVKAVNSYATRSSDSILITTGNNVPVLPAISNVAMKTGDTLRLNLIASDDPEDTLTLSASGLPAFATLTNSGNGTGVLTLTPGNNAVGSYNGITVTVTDNKGGSASRTFNVSVKDKTITNVYININETAPVAPAPWNNTSTAPAAGKTTSNLLDENGVNTGMSLVQVDGIQGSNTLGAVTGNNSGVYPDAVMTTQYYEGSDNIRKLRFTNVPTGKKYNLVFFGSRSGVTDNRNTDYTAGGQTVTLNAASNTSNTVQINGLIPDANGYIEFTFKRSSGSSFGYLGAVVLQSYIDNGLPTSPNNLTAIGISKSAIKLTWTDRASNETGYEVWRSLTAEGTYSLVTTTAANVTTYQDNSLNKNTTYYYKVRAVASSIYSDYSNTTNAATYAYTMFMNFNRDNPAAAPWNNTNNVPMTGQIFSNLLNDEGNNSGLSVTVINNFSGENPFGMNTGNNSGVYPDNVIRSTWWLDIGTAARIRVDGLNQAQSYSFTFFGSRDGGGDRTTVYAINGKSVSLNCSNNISQTVTLTDVRPDENGGVYVDISLGATSSFGYLGAMVISGYTAKDTSGNGLQPLQARTSGVTYKNTSNASLKGNVEVISAYPNPFQGQVILQLNNTGASKDLAFKLYKADGQLVSGKAFPQVASGSQQLRLDFSNYNLPAGVYMLQVISNGTPVKTIKLIKN